MTYSRSDNPIELLQPAAVLWTTPMNDWYVHWCSEYCYPAAPHPLVLLSCGEDLGLSDEDVAEGPTAAALLVETGYGTHGESLYLQGLGVGQPGLLGHHTAHIADVPARAQGDILLLYLFHCSHWRRVSLFPWLSTSLLMLLLLFWYKKNKITSNRLCKWDENL